ncbi:hypothetical protein K3152_04785 [Qipengyuania sp. 1NDH17]|uniref:Reverse transcriptase domain-containing protein n=1 Tax=Qipengyuania polymorpha TaxID=2867234 RepID=A0ABS7IYM6_9SPHN|nr:hypothetical protein [Qipengyuania polymorpha]MBX7457557.1 hypothetical protein [Qipengyuania polymorpha]
MKKEYQSWADVGLDDLFFAYRKAKVDCFYELSVRVAEKFVLFEQELVENLTKLLSDLQTGKIDEVLARGMGEPAIFPKKLSAKSNDNSHELHTFFSDTKRSFNRQKKNGLKPEFRIIGDFSVEVHLLSALWVNLVGHKFDAKLSQNALASRLRRYRQDPLGHGIGDYHLEALGSFEPYFQPYRKWRDEGLEAIEESLKREQGVVALTLDVSNFYHRIDPKFAVHPDFLGYMELELDEFQTYLNQKMVSALSQWSELCAFKLRELGADDDVCGGLPIGLSIVRLLSNVLLAYLDREMTEHVSPVYYARYVDDIFLVLKDNEGFDDQHDVWHMLELRLPFLKRDKSSGAVRLNLPAWGKKSTLVFKPEKQKCFFLTGASGLDLLASIASQIREVSSERRLMPLPEQLDQTQSAKALTASDTADEADSLRRADGLTLRRLGWSVLLRSIEVLARDLRPADWEVERQRFYDFAHNHVIRPDKILEQLDRLPRLFSVAISLSDWKPALRIYRSTVSAIFELQEAVASSTMAVNGYDCGNTRNSVWEETREQVRKYFHEAFFRSISIAQKEPRARAFQALLQDLDITYSKLQQLALQAHESDWARRSYKDHIKFDAQRHAPSQQQEDMLYGRYDQEELLRRFLEHSNRPNELEPCSRVNSQIDKIPYDSLIPFLFPTRAYTPEEIALYLPEECVFGDPIVVAHSWADYTRAVRGVWIRSPLADDMAKEVSSDTTSEASAGGGHLGRDIPRSPYDIAPPEKIVIEDGGRERPIKIGITSFKTSDKTWAMAAANKPDLSPRRYRAIASIVNAALKERERPDYIVFPELSIPEKWVSTITNKLREGNIGLIGGLDYNHYPVNLVESSAVIVLDDRRLGYSNALQIRQRKSQPAPGEEKNLLHYHKKKWNRPASDPKPVYIHNGFNFSVLVCSELQNVNYRKHLQGHIDCLFVLSWNKDIETFSALVDSASLDVHTYVALSNNLRYGDSRVRRPAKKSHHRDVCRVRGGLNDQLVVVEIDPTILRQQQSRGKRWPELSDKYKPAPEDFRISDERETIPE